MDLADITGHLVIRYLEICLLDGERVRDLGELCFVPPPAIMKV